MLKARKQTAMTIHRTVMLHMTPYNTGDIVISLRTTFGWSDGGPLPLKRKKVNNVVCTNVHKGQSNMVGTHKKGKEKFRHAHKRRGRGRTCHPSRSIHSCLPFERLLCPKGFLGDEKDSSLCTDSPPPLRKIGEKDSLPDFFWGEGDVFTQPLEGQEPWERACS